MDNINKKLDDNSNKLAKIQLNLDKLTWAPRHDNAMNSINYKTLAYIGLGLLLHAIVTWILTRK